MRTLKLHFPEAALPTLDTFVKQTKEVRVFRRAQAVREVVKGQRLQNRLRRAPVYVFCPAEMGASLCQPRHSGLVDRPRSGRPPKVTCELEQHLNRLVDQDSWTTAPSIPNGVVANLRPS